MLYRIWGWVAEASLTYNKAFSLGDWGKMDTSKFVTEEVTTGLCFQCFPLFQLRLMPNFFKVCCGSDWSLTKWVPQWCPQRPARVTGGAGDYQSIKPRPHPPRRHWQLYPRRHADVCSMVGKYELALVEANSSGMTPRISTLSMPSAYTLIFRASNARAFISGVLFSRLSNTRL